MVARNGLRMGLSDMRICSPKWTSRVLEMGSESAGCEWDSWTCAYAAENGHLACLKWAREAGCEWDSLDMRICSP